MCFGALPRVHACMVAYTRCQHQIMVPTHADAVSVLHCYLHASMNIRSCNVFAPYFCSLSDSSFFSSSDSVLGSIAVVELSFQSDKVS